MDIELQLTAEDEEFRREVRQFLDENLPDGWGTPAYRVPPGKRVDFARDWQRRLYEAGLAAVAWPREFGGRDATMIQQIIYNREMAKRSAPEPINRSALQHTGPTIIQWGSDWQRQRFLPPLLRADELWCQGFSEPDAGSDLASLRTKAIRKGDHFVLTGQKIWTSRAHIADWCIVLARTDPEAPKHHGISCLLVDMRSDGITVQPIKQISGDSDFNQVFFDEVLVPDNCLLGELNEGWRVATTTLSYERAGQGNTTRIERRLRQVAVLAAQTLVDGRARIDDPLFRDELMQYAVITEGLRQIASRAMVAGLRGRQPGAEAAFAKVMTSETDQRLSELAMNILGPHSSLGRGSQAAPKNGNVPLGYLLVRGATIGGGTSEMQRNVIAEKLLGLPKD